MMMNLLKVMKTKKEERMYYLPLHKKYFEDKNIHTPSRNFCLGLQVPNLKISYALDNSYEVIFEIILTHYNLRLVVKLTKTFDRIVYKMESVTYVDRTVESMSKSLAQET